jgi:FRG domain
MNKYKYKEFGKWDKFCEMVEKRYKNKPNEKWIFRGTAPGKPLRSSLDRALEYYPPEFGKKRKLTEEILLREFKRRFHQYSSYIPEENDDLEWFSIMQHYGAPTRLLDFTYSFYNAAYFALEYAGEDYLEVFAVNAIWAIEQSAKKFNNSKKANSFFKSLIGNTEKDRTNFKHYFRGRFSKKFVCPFNPFRLNERISFQRGVFMCPANVDETFDDNLKGLLGWNKETNVVRFILKFKKEEIVKAREHLRYLNITRANLFPGLEGFAKSLTQTPPKFLEPVSQKQLKVG